MRFPAWGLMEPMMLRPSTRLPSHSSAWNVCTIAVSHTLRMCAARKAAHSFAARLPGMRGPKPTCASA